MNISILRPFCYALLGVASSACALHGAVSTRQYPALKDSRASYHVVTPQAQVLAEVMKTPTDFFLTYPDCKYGWERAQLFFRNHTSKSNYVAGRGDVEVLSNKGTGDATVYSVERRSAPEG